MSTKENMKNVFFSLSTFLVLVEYFYNVNPQHSGFSDKYIFTRERTTICKCVGYLPEEEHRAGK